MPRPCRVYWESLHALHVLASDRAATVGRDPPERPVRVVCAGSVRPRRRAPVRHCALAAWTAHGRACAAVCGHPYRAVCVCVQLRARTPSTHTGTHTLSPPLSLSLPSSLPPSPSSLFLSVTHTHTHTHCTHTLHTHCTHTHCTHTHTHTHTHTPARTHTHTQSSGSPPPTSQPFASPLAPPAGAVCQGGQGRAGALTSAPRPAPPGAPWRRGPGACLPGPGRPRLPASCLSARAPRHALFTILEET